MRKVLWAIVALTIVFTFTALAKDKYIQYDINKLNKKSEARLKHINKKLPIIEKEENAKKKAEELDSLYAKAEKLYAEGKYKEAKPIYEKIKKYTKDPDVKKAAYEKKKELERLEKQKKMEQKEALRRKLKEEKRKKKEQRKAERKARKKKK